MPRKKRVTSVETMMSQPTQHLKREYQLQVSFNGLELQTLHKAAEKAHLSLAAYVRMAAMSYRRRD